MKKVNIKNELKFKKKLKIIILELFSGKIKLQFLKRFYRTHFCQKDFRIES